MQGEAPNKPSQQTHRWHGDIRAASGLVRLARTAVLANSRSGSHRMALAFLAVIFAAWLLLHEASAPLHPAMIAKLSMSGLPVIRLELEPIGNARKTRHSRGREPRHHWLRSGNRQL